MTGPSHESNVFILLELDPERPWERALGEAALATAQAAWTRAAAGIQTAQRTIEARTNLSRVKDIRSVLEDRDKLDRQRKEALLLREAKLARRRKELGDLLDVWLAKGFLLEPESARARAESAGMLDSSPELCARLDRAPVRSVDAGAASPGLGAERENLLRQLLRAVNAGSLYEVLKEGDPGVGEHSSNDELRAAADRLAAKMHGIKNKNDQKIGHMEKLGGLAKVIFESDDERRRYNEWLKANQLRELVEWFEGALAHASEATAAQVELYLRRAREARDIDVAQARTFLIAQFRKRKWVLQLPGDEVEQRLMKLIRCARCQQLNEPTERFCATCGNDLRLPCPNCGRVDPQYGGGCGCGFPIGLRALVESLVVQGEEALRQVDFAQARLNLDRAARIWRLPAHRVDALAARIRAAQHQLEAVLGQLDATGVEIERLMSERRFVAAAQRLRAAPDALPQRDTLLAQADRAVREARALYRQAREPQRSPAERTELYAEALRICDDFAAARTELQQIKPEPPYDVRATVDAPDAGVLVQWDPSPEADVSYVVIRATGGASPVSAEDLPGQVHVGTTAAATWRDRGATGVAGQPLRYAVFTERRGTFSTAAVSNLVLVAADPASVLCHAEDGRVVLTWSVPEHAARVEVRRTELGSAAGSVVLRDVRRGRAVDAEVRNGVRYRYTVRVAYQDPGGRLWWSAGVERDATPIERPSPPGSLTVTGTDSAIGMFVHRTQVRWPAPEAGVVKVVRQRGAGLLREGEQLAEEALQRDGFTLSGASPVEDVWIEDDLEVCSYFPVLVLDRIAHVGQARRYARATEPVGPHGEFVGSYVHVGWNWPEGATAALVGYDSVTAPADPTAAPGQVTVGRVEGERFGGCYLPVTGGAVHAIVGRVVHRDGVDFVTSGVPVQVRRPAVRVEYEVHALNRRRRELLLHTARPVVLPALVLVGRTDRLPHTREDGETVERLASLRLNGRQVVPLPRADQRTLQYRLFTAAVADSATVELDNRAALRV